MERWSSGVAGTNLKKKGRKEARSFMRIFCLNMVTCILGFFLSTAGAQSDKDYFKGKTITVIAGSSPGGGTDSLARLLSRHFAKQIPGNPKIVVTNVAGAAGLIAANQLYNKSPKDGTAIGT